MFALDVFWPVYKKTGGFNSSYKVLFSSGVKSHGSGYLSFGTNRGYFVRYFSIHRRWLKAHKKRIVLLTNYRPYFSTKRVADVVTFICKNFRKFSEIFFSFMFAIFLVSFVKDRLALLKNSVTKEDVNVAREHVEECSRHQNMILRELKEAQKYTWQKYLFGGVPSVEEKNLAEAYKKAQRDTENARNTYEEALKKYKVSQNINESCDLVESAVVSKNYSQQHDPDTTSPGTLVEDNDTLDP